MALTRRDTLFLIPIPFAILSYLLLPFTNDLYIFQGVARLTDYYGSFPASIDAAWEMKPLGNRLINYLLYKLITSVTEFGSPWYPVIGKLLAVGFALACCYYFARSFRSEYVIPVFSITAFAMLSPINFVLMQAEWYSVLISLVCVGLLLRKNLAAYALAGMLLFALFTIKGITLLLAAPVILYLAIVTEEPYVFFEKLFYAAIGFSAGAAAFLVMCLTIFPHAIPDMLMITTLANIGKYPLYVYFLLTVNQFPLYSSYVPAFFFSMVMTLYFVFNMKGVSLFKRGLAALMWIPACLIVFVQGEFFLYHYFVLILPGILAFVLVLEHSREGLEKYLYLIAYGSMIVFFVISTSYIGSVTVGELEFYRTSGYPAGLNERFNISSEPSVLYLDPGAAPYFFRSNSSCRYSTPMPVARYKPDWNTSHLPAYAELYSCIMDYHGRYIIAQDGWFGRNLSERAEIYQKIDREYTLVWNKSWDVYERRY